jgi:hypothetical protein
MGILKRDKIGISNTHLSERIGSDRYKIGG